MATVLPLLARHHEAARSSLPAKVYDYYASGSGQQLSVGEASESWSRYRLRPRVLRDVARPDLSVELLGDAFASPVGFAPSAFQRLAHDDAERASAAAARSAGALFVLSTRSSLLIEDVAAVAGPWWFQVYVMKDRALTKAVVQRAAAAGARALVLTGDTPLVGRKYAVGAERIALPDDHFAVNLARHLGHGEDARAAAAQDPSVTLEAIGWLADASRLPVVVKGVLRDDDAAACLDAGAAGVVVSNHGGRQLDRAVPTAAALPAVVEAVAGRGVVLVDGGIRSGADVLTALALGADAVLLGRPVLWALAAGGQDGAQALLTAMNDDLAHVCALAGAARIADLDPSWVLPPFR